MSNSTRERLSGVQLQEVDSSVRPPPAFYYLKATVIGLHTCKVGKSSGVAGQIAANMNDGCVPAYVIGIRISS
jgi:hypothetical protein